MRLVALLALFGAAAACSAKRDTQPAPEPSPAPPDADVRPSLLTTFGSPHPVVVTAADRKRRWAAICQATQDTNGDGKIAIVLDDHGGAQGDRLESLLVLPSGAQAIDELVAASPSGDHILLVRAGKLHLRDVRADHEVTLASTSALAAFAPEGDRVAYVRTAGHEVLAVMRDVETGEEREFRLATGMVARLEVAGAWLVVKLAGKTEARSTLAKRRCRAHALVWSEYPSSDSAPTRLYLPINGGKARERPDVVGVLGDVLLRRVASGRLVGEDADGNIKEIVPAACRGQVLHGDHATGQVLVACTAKPRYWPLELHGARPRVALGVYVDAVPRETMRWPADRIVIPGPRVHPRRTPAELPFRGAAIDMQTQTVVRPPDGGTLVAVDGDAMLIRRAGTLFWRTVGSATETRVIEVGSSSHSRLENGRYLTVAGTLIDTANGKVLGELSLSPLAVSIDHHVLVAASKRGRALVGPLEWRALSNSAR